MIIPYAKVGDAWSLPDELIELSFNRMVRDGTLKTVFWDGKITNYEQLLGHFRKPSNLPVFIFDNNELVAFAWLNSIGHNFAFSHFCTFREIWGKDKSHLIDELFDYWFSFSYENGYLFDVLIGMVPETNVHALKFLDECGYKVVGPIPGLINDYYAREKKAAVISYRSR